MSRRAVRADFLDVVNTLLSGLTDEKIEIRHDYTHIAIQILERVGEESLSEEIPRWEAIRDALLNPDTKIEWWKSIHHDSRWIRLRNSFHGSKEWREFRLRWLEEHPACARCGQTDGLLQVHHAGRFTLDWTVLDEGFLEGLHHPERFETLCGDCHMEGHADMIEAEKADLQGGR